MVNKNSKGFKIDQQFQLYSCSHNDETKWYAFILEH
jgi:hypothetical protein